MTELSARDLQAVLDVVGDFHHAEDLDGFRAAVLPALRALVDTDFSSYNEVPGEGPAGIAVVDPPLEPWAYEVWGRHGATNPLVQHYLRTRDGRAHRFSDVCTHAELEALPLYQELYKPLGIECQVSVVMPSPPDLVVGVVLSRGFPDFTDRDCAVLDATRPHLIQAYRNADLRGRALAVLGALHRRMDDVADAVLVVQDGRVLFASTPAQHALQSHGLPPAPEGRRLPAPLADWLGRRESARLPLLLGDGVRPLAVRRLPDRPGEPVVVLLEPGTRGVSLSLLEQLGLTPREAEVLQALMRGLPNAEIAAQLAISPRTVHKHVERIFDKLGVRDRVQAVATAWAAVGGGALSASGGPDGAAATAGSPPGPGRR